VKGADYVAKRLAFAVLTVFIAVTINFALFRLAPGSAVTNLARVPHATPETRLAIKRQFGLDKSKLAQYGIFLKQLVRGNLGVSFANSQPVKDNLRTALINTIPMVFLGTLFAIVLGTLTGILAAWRRGTAAEGATVTTALGFYSMPTHWLGLMLVILFAGVLPTGGMANEFLIDPPFWTHVKDLAEHIALPSLTLGLVLYGEYTLIVRSAMLETLGEDYSDRDGLLVAGDRPRGLRRGAAARLPDASGRLSAADDLGRLLQPDRRPPLLQARPEDNRMSVARLRLAPVGETMFPPRAPFLQPDVVEPPGSPTPPPPAHRPRSGR
jgi:ABC-type dipeptide/oligopeptide/nickel transport system permease subunit